MADSAFVNYYELLQVSPGAPAKLIELAARLIGSQYHPKNPQTGDAEKYDLVKVAYRTLADAASRKKYDEELASQGAASVSSATPASDQHTGPVMAPKDGQEAVRVERAKRSRIMALLYAQLLDDPDNPGVSTAELVQQMGYQREDMLFALWFLREQGLARVTDKGVYSLTTDGCAWVEDGGVPEFTFTPEDGSKKNVRALPAPAEQQQSTLVALADRVAENRC